MNTYVLTLPNGQTVYAGPDLTEATYLADEWTAHRARFFPGEATPHLVIAVWVDGRQDWTTDYHVYGHIAGSYAAMDYRVSGSYAERTADEIDNSDDYLSAHEGSF